MQNIREKDNNMTKLGCITEERISPNRSHVAKRKVVKDLFDKSRNSNNDLCKISIFEQILQQSKEEQASLVPELLEVIEQLKESINQFRKLREVDNYQILHLEIKLEQLQRDHQNVCREYAKLKGFDKKSYHKGKSKMSAD